MKLADTTSEFIRYSPYGVPTSSPRGDYDLDGDVDAADTTALGNFIAGGSYGWNLDFNGDGNVDSGDTDEHAAYVTGYDKGLGGRTVLSRSGVRNRAGYAGYEFEPALPNSAWHVRHRVLVSELGRWNRRDPLIGFMTGRSWELIAELRREAPGAVDCLRAIASTDIENVSGSAQSFSSLATSQLSAVPLTDLATDWTGLACTVRAECRNYSSSPAASLPGQTCITCNYICGETSREDSAGGPSGCDSVPPRQAWTKSTQYCEWGTTPPTCPSYDRDRRIWYENQPGGDLEKSRKCSRVACRDGCKVAADHARDLCDKLETKVCQEACKAVATTTQQFCNDTCNAWCVLP